MLKRTRFNYWSSSKFANFIRGESKPLVLGRDEWDEWHKNAKNKRPFRYWFAETGLKKLQNLIYYPSDLYYTVDVYVRNRWISKLQYLRTGLKPGEYYDLDTRILHGLFNELVIFVESEQAHLIKAYPERKYKFVKGRCKEAGLDYLNWSDQLIMNEDYGLQKDDPEYGKPTSQAIYSKKIGELYYWWTVTRPNRIDPYTMFTKKEIGLIYYKRIQELEDRYLQEDTDMLIELVKIRGAMWT